MADQKMAGAAMASWQIENGSGVEFRIDSQDEGRRNHRGEQVKMVVGRESIARAGGRSRKKMA